MSDDPLQVEVERLRTQVEEYRLRELAELKAALAEARESAAHYRAEAQRNADLGREIAANCDKQLAEMRVRLEAAKNVRRPAS